MENVIKMIYEKVKDVLLLNVEERYKEEMARKYLDYLYKTYSSTNFDDYELDKVINFIVKAETNQWENVPVSYKLRRFIDDKNYEKVQIISNKGYVFAKEKIEKGASSIISKKEANDNCELLINLLPLVKDFNKQEAKQLVSEGILDFHYASSNVDIISLRIGHLHK